MQEHKHALDLEELENTEPNRNTTVDTETYDGFYIEAHVVSGNAVEELKVRNYGNFAHHFIPKDSRIAKKIDVLIQEFAVENNIINSFNRPKTEGYEFLVESKDIAYTSGEYNSRNDVEIQLTKDSSSYSLVKEIIKTVNKELN